MCEGLLHTLVAIRVETTQSEFTPDSSVEIGVEPETKLALRDQPFLVSGIHKRGIIQQPRVATQSQYPIPTYTLQVLRGRSDSSEAEVVHNEGSQTDLKNGAQ